jgi:hypothetical protein
MEITKKSGEQVPYDAQELCQSIEQAGASKMDAQRICIAIEEKLDPGDSTTKIFRTALRELMEESVAVSARYKLRRALDDLGPTGFIFEQYVETILQAHDYDTRRNVMMSGECVTHEIDVYAEKDNLHFLVEAKYRNDHSIKTHVDTVMYADARLMDVQRRMEKRGEDPQNYHIWVITNTNFTSHAIDYGACRNMKLVGWNYPKNNGLESMIVNKKLYPITVLPSLTRKARDMLVKHDMVLAQDILPYSQAELEEKFHLNNRVAKNILAEVHAIMK